MPRRPEHLDYNSGRDPRPPWPRSRPWPFPWPFFIRQVVLWTGMTFVFLFLGLLFMVMPKFAQVLQDSKAQLPAVTELLLRSGRLLGRIRLMIGPMDLPVLGMSLCLVPLAVPLLLARLVQRCPPESRRGLARALTLLVMLPMAGLVLLVIYALFAPMVALITSMSK